MDPNIPIQSAQPIVSEVKPIVSPVPEQPSGIKPKLSKWIIVVVVVLILLTIGGVSAYFLNKNSLMKNLSSPTPTSIPTSTLISTSGCRLESGPSDTLFKVFILSNGNLRYFQDRKNQIINQFKTISPFSNYFNKIAFYILSIPPEKKIACGRQTSGAQSLGGSGFACDQQQVDAYISSECGLTNVKSFIKMIISEETAGGSGGEIISLGTNSSLDLPAELALSQNTAIHEVGHNMGLADLYYGTLYFNGDPSIVYSNEVATGFPNTDIAGCPKWCKSYKPVNNYNSVSCPTITDETSCRTINRESGGFCKAPISVPQPNNSTTPPSSTETCCIWDNQGFDYFGKCAPAIGSENIGIDCQAGTGCYFGAAYGNNAWRPVKNGDESIMFSTKTNKFDPVSEKWLSSVLECCMSNNASTKCTAFKKTYAQFISKVPSFKQNIGYCTQNN